MPGLSRRREEDIRADRFESQIRKDDLKSNTRVFVCSKCRYPFEEKSRNCPRCDTKTMNEIKPIPPQYVEEARRKAIRKMGYSA